MAVTGLILHLLWRNELIPNWFVRLGDVPAYIAVGGWGKGWGTIFNVTVTTRMLSALIRATMIAILMFP